MYLTYTIKKRNIILDHVKVKATLTRSTLNYICKLDFHKYTSPHFNRNKENTFPYIPLHYLISNKASIRKANTAIDEMTFSKSFFTLCVFWSKVKRQFSTFSHQEQHFSSSPTTSNHPNS